MYIYIYIYMISLWYSIVSLFLVVVPESLQSSAPCNMINLSFLANFTII